MADDLSLSARKYDVFVSFRGSDTRNTIVSHLFAALRARGVLAYKDDVTLAKGEAISSALVEAIESSRIALVVFSENYAESRWCLDELGHLLRCKRERGHVVLPVFYGVDPSHIRRQTESYGRAFDAHVLRYQPGKVLQWRSDLEEAGNLSGWDSRDNRPEAELVDHIVKDILNKLSIISSKESEKDSVSGCKSVMRVDRGGCKIIETVDANGCRLVEKIDINGCSSTERSDANGCKVIVRNDVHGCIFIERIDAHGRKYIDKIDSSGCKSIDKTGNCC